MQLIGYQIKCFDDLYDNIVNNARQFILFSGPKGCGKSTILNELNDMLNENWKVFMISGAGNASPPYYTWYSTAHKSTMPQKRKVDISFGVNFQPLGLPIGFEMSVGVSGSETAFNSNEQAIIKAIRHETNGKDNVLFLAEDYDLWDPSSKQFLIKLLNGQVQILGEEKHIHIVLVDTVFDDAVSFGNKEENALRIHISEIPLDDIEQIIAQQSTVSTMRISNLERIVQFTGYDLRLITLAACYAQGRAEITEINSLKDLLELRISNMAEGDKAICRALEHVSIIHSLFSEKEAAYLLDEPLIKVERMLNEAVSLKLIHKQNAYDFPNSEIRRYFEERLDIEKKYLHYRFAQYLQIFYPEDYHSRAYHLFLSEGVNQDASLSDAAYLLVIEKLRRSEITDGASELILDERLNEILSSLPQIISQFVKSNISSFSEGCYQLSQCKYAEAILLFSSLHHMYASKAFSVEASRLLLLSHVQLADDLNAIKQLADNLYNKLNEDAFTEDELWCRAALLLLEIYGDRHMQIEKFNNLRNGFDTRVRRHAQQSAFRALHAKYEAKSSLFFPSIIAVKLTEDSCKYYRTYNSTANLYYSLCNNAANLIICGEYIEAKSKLEECRDLVEDNPSIKFPSSYKVENNFIICNFLHSEGPLFDYLSRDKDKTVAAARDAVERLKNLRNQQGYEVSHVIDFNLFSMLMVSEEFGGAAEILRQFEIEYRHLDNFYKYYYHNACCASNLLNRGFDEAMGHLEQMENLDVVLLSGFSKILKKRNRLLYDLITERYDGGAFAFNYEFIRRGILVQDPSASFWGRGFLLSDFQFLSQ